MAVENSRRIPLDKAASFAELTDAIKSLTPAQFRRLQKFAEWRIRGLGRKSAGRSWRDLFHDAVAAFYSDFQSGEGRRWNKEKVNVVKTLIEAMRSISYAWSRSFDSREAYLESELITTSPSGEESNPMTTATAPGWNVQKDLELKHKIEIIEKLLAERELASLILLGLREGMSGREVRDDLGISQTQYETEMKWIRRTLRTYFKE